LKSNYRVLKSKLKAIKNQDLVKPPTHRESSKVYWKANSKAPKQDTDPVDQSSKKLLKGVDSSKSNNNFNNEAVKLKEEEGE
jgi:hypothetical protein